MIHRMKIGAAFVAEVQMTPDEWAAIDPDALLIEAAISQSGDNHAIVPTIDPDRRAVVLTFDTSALAPGRALFDVWINGGPLPWARNVTLDLFAGIAR